MDVTLGDSFHSVMQRIKEAHGLTRDAASIKLYDDRGLNFWAYLRTTIIDNYRWDLQDRMLNIPLVIELIVELEEE